MTSDHLISGRFAVVGNPIQHSLSPVIHSAFAQQSGRQIDYRAELVGLDTFEGWVTHFLSAGWARAQCDLPFKTRAYALADEVSDRARAAGAANFLAQNAAGQMIADNTDGKGMVVDMTDNAGWSLNGARVLVLGAGGAVKGVIPSLLQAAPECIVVANRTSARAEALAAEWIDQSTPVSGGELRPGASDALGCDYQWHQHGAFERDAGLARRMVLLGRTATVTTWRMAKGLRRLCRWASRARCRLQTRDGLGMLVEQAAESFYLWLGDYPETQPVIADAQASTRSGTFDQALLSRYRCLSEV